MRIAYRRRAGGAKAGNGAPAKAPPPAPTADDYLAAMMADGSTPREEAPLPELRVPDQRARDYHHAAGYARITESAPGDDDDDGEDYEGAADAREDRR